MSNYSVKVGVEIIVKQGDNILFGKRKNALGEGEWGLPGGHIEVGEKLIETAMRELKEETGIEAIKDQLELIAVVDDPNSFSGNHYIHFAFLIEQFTGEPKLCEPDKCEGWRWFDINELPEIFRGHRGIIRTFKKGILYLK